MENRSLPPILKNRADFQNLFKNGKRLYPYNWLIINLQKNNLSTNRYGWTVPKFVGNAVLRNRFKRWGRDYLRHHHSLLSDKSYDLNFVWKRKEKGFYKKISREDFEKCFYRAFKAIKENV